MAKDKGFAARVAARILQVPNALFCINRGERGRKEGQ